MQKPKTMTPAPQFRAQVTDIDAEHRLWIIEFTGLSVSRKCWLEDEVPHLITSPPDGFSSSQLFMGFVVPKVLTELVEATLEALGDGSWLRASGFARNWVPQAASMQLQFVPVEHDHADEQV